MEFNEIWEKGRPQHPENLTLSKISISSTRIEFCPDRNGNHGNLLAKKSNLKRKYFSLIVLRWAIVASWASCYATELKGSIVMHYPSSIYRPYKGPAKCGCHIVIGLSVRACVRACVLLERNGSVHFTVPRCDTFTKLAPTVILKWSSDTK